MSKPTADARTVAEFDPGATPTDLTNGLRLLVRSYLRALDDLHAAVATYRGGRHDSDRFQAVLAAQDHLGSVRESLRKAAS